MYIYIYLYIYIYVYTRRTDGAKSPVLLDLMRSPRCNAEGLVGPKVLVNSPSLIKLYRIPVSDPKLQKTSSVYK